ncbi:MAG: nickel-type superoxide dismutase maturation protease [Candidatus Limnocylindria bacterium]
MRKRGLIWPLLAFLGALAARRWLDVVEVRGRSMLPTLQPGDRLLVLRASSRLGDVVVTHDPREPDRELIKRVSAADASGVTLRGDNAAASTDARVFGAIPATRVQWRVIGRYWPPGRAGRLPVRMIRDEGGESACTFPSALIAGD